MKNVFLVVYYTPKHMGNLRQGNSSVSNDLSLSTTRSGQIQDRVKPFAIEEGQKKKVQGA